MGRGSDRGRLQFTWRDRGRCYPLSGRKRRPDHAGHSALGNWSRVPVADGAFAPGPIAAAPPGAWRGELIMTGAVLCMAFYNVWSRPFIQRSSALGFLTVGMGAGA